MTKKQRDPMVAAAMKLALRTYTEHQNAVDAWQRASAFGMLIGLYVGALYFGPSGALAFVDNLKDRAAGMRWSKKNKEVIWRDQPKEKAA